MESTIEICCCYAHNDRPFLNQLKKHLMPLQRQELVKLWHDQDISAGTEWEREIESHLNTAQIILLLISPDFMNSDHCYDKETKRAMESHENGKACVIPIILRPVHWKEASFGKLQALPSNTRPIVDPCWHSQDEAFYDVTEGIRQVIKQLTPIHYKLYLQEIVQAYHKALKDARKFGYDVCLECGSTNLRGDQEIDYNRDETYYFLHCEECGWFGEGDPFT